MKQITSQIHSRPFEKRSNPNITAKAVGQMAMMGHANGRKYG